MVTDYNHGFLFFCFILSVRPTLAAEKGEIWFCPILCTSLWIEEWVALSYFSCEKPIGSFSFKACKEGRIFSINYTVILLILHEQYFHPLSFSEWVNNYALQPVKFHICNELWNKKLWEENKFNSDWIPNVSWP